MAMNGKPAISVKVGKLNDVGVAEVEVQVNGKSHMDSFRLEDKREPYGIDGTVVIYRRDKCHGTDEYLDYSINSAVEELTFWLEKEL